MQSDLRIRALTAGFVLALLTGAEPAHARDQTFYSPDEFRRVLEAARSNGGVLQGIMQNSKSVPYIGSIEAAGDNAWKVTINAAWDISGGEMEFTAYPALVTNHGNRMEFTFLAQPLPASLAEQILAYKDMRKGVEIWTSKFKDLNLMVALADNRVSITSAYDYASGVSDDDLEKRLIWLSHAAYGAIVWSAVGGREVKEQRLKELDGKLVYLGRDDFLLLTEQTSGDLAIDVDGVTEGAWRFAYQKRKMEALNYGDRVVLRHWRRLDLTGTERDDMLRALQEWAARSKLKGAAVSVEWHPKDERDLMVTATFTFDGKLKGKDFAAGYWAFKREFSAAAGEQIDTILKNR